MGSIPGSGRFPRGDHGKPLQYSCLENPMDRGAWRDTVHRVSKSQTQLKQLSKQMSSTLISVEMRILSKGRQQKENKEGDEVKKISQTGWCKKKKKKSNVKMFLQGRDILGQRLLDSLYVTWQASLKELCNANWVCGKQAIELCMRMEE